MTDAVPVGDAGGLSDLEAAARLRAEGPNELLATRPKRLVRIAVDVLREPMLLLLAASALVYLILGDVEGALALLAAVALVVEYAGRQTEHGQKPHDAAYALRQGNWIDGALAGLTLAISMVPEEFPVILAVFLAFGAWPRHQVQTMAGHGLRVLAVAHAVHPLDALPDSPGAGTRALIA